MTPLFSSAKMKNMFHLIQKCSYVFETAIDKEVANNPKEIEVRNLTAKFTMECIGACAFGIDANTLTDDATENPFTKIAASFLGDPIKIFYPRIVRSVWPSIFYGLGQKFLSKQVQFFHDMLTSVMSQRNYQFSGRHDFVDLVMSWKQNKYIEGDSIKTIKNDTAQKKISLEANDDLLVSQCFVFFFAGFETSSTTMSYTLFELAKHQDFQKKVLEEIDAYLARNNNKLVYECITELPYLEAAIHETLRLYPVLGTILREQMEDYTFPNGITIEKGIRIHLPVLYLHYNPEYFPNPEEYRPERFLGEEKKKIVPYTYMPFGEGPRICIGMRFARMQMMAGLITILKKYHLELADGMPRKLQFVPESLVVQPIGGTRLKFIEREGWEKRVFVK